MFNFGNSTSQTSEKVPLNFIRPIEQTIDDIVDKIYEINESDKNT